MGKLDARFFRAPQAPGQAFGTLGLRLQQLAELAHRLAEGFNRGNELGQAHCLRVGEACAVVAEREPQVARRLVEF